MAIPPHKRPSAIANIKLEKKPVASLQDIGGLRPAWRVSQLEMVDPFGWHNIDEPTLHYIRGKLANYESMTMHEIFVKGKTYNHGVSLNKLCAAALKRLQVLHLDDLDEVHRLRLSGVERVWGIRDLNVLNLLWWDPFHQICP